MGDIELIEDYNWSTIGTVNNMLSRYPSASLDYFAKRFSGETIEPGILIVYGKRLNTKMEKKSIEIATQKGFGKNKRIIFSSNYPT